MKMSNEMADSFKNEGSINFFAKFLDFLHFLQSIYSSQIYYHSNKEHSISNSEFQNFTDTYLGKVTKFQFDCFSRLGAAFQKPEASGLLPPVQLGLRCVQISDI